MSEISNQFITGGWRLIAFKIQKISEHAKNLEDFCADNEEVSIIPEDKGIRIAPISV